MKNTLIIPNITIYILLQLTSSKYRMSHRNETWDYKQSLFVVLLVFEKLQGKSNSQDHIIRKKHVLPTFLTSNITSTNQKNRKYGVISFNDSNKCEIIFYL
jgi:hypothetical protein